MIMMIIIMISDMLVLLITVQALDKIVRTALHCKQFTSKQLRYISVLCTHAMSRATTTDEDQRHHEDDELCTAPPVDNV